jgi:hypothetical protein
MGEWQIHGPHTYFMAACARDPRSYSTGLLTCFELTVGETWSMSMYWYMKHVSDALGYPTVVVEMFFIIMFVWMNCILFSLYGRGPSIILHCHFRYL